MEHAQGAWTRLRNRDIALEARQLGGSFTGSAAHMPATSAIPAGQLCGSIMCARPQPLSTVRQGQHRGDLITDTRHIALLGAGVRSGIGAEVASGERITVPQRHLPGAQHRQERLVLVAKDGMRKTPVVALRHRDRPPGGVEPRLKHPGRAEDTGRPSQRSAHQLGHGTELPPDQASSPSATGLLPSLC